MCELQAEETGVHRSVGGTGTHIITNDACKYCSGAALSGLLGAKKKEQISLLMRESKMHH